ncbi:diaminobutyrate--2-oxoglutarate transaminase [Opitutus terrae]|uniref:Diaminobutyrate--2-oxoglutarate transaminase n=1 Tax=Opitutus terrae (strain DSM 11246 / JCM 15787 / PB90-1) TaxID=452637 RepID=B1ZYM1_OPITP|nr:diaminobutyrate--2-oxoglutarate transaminase [Opitutus terrae]ACB75257.1 diaminobutyrate--2-oxoglutarate aminotransferase [Opitutus terrae PB90-1]
MNVFQRRESEVRSYIRSFPVLFEKGRGAQLFDREGRSYLDFFAGAGALNYGHNPEPMKQALIRYLETDGVTHSLDMATEAKRRFLALFEEIILKPRGLDYKVQFTGPTGANGVEAALKLARRVKQRRNVVAFTNAYHGLSLGALAATANEHYRHEAWVQRQDVSFVPYDGYLGPDVDTAAVLRKLLDDGSSGVDLPAAVILETVQAEGGVNVASHRWLQEVARICRERDVLLIVDDIQVGCGRTGTFFSFERAGFTPDIVVLSKSISGYGLPMSLVLIRPDIDQWQPGEHTGTFRGNNLAFVAAAEALSFWATAEFAETVSARGRRLGASLQDLIGDFPAQLTRVRGVGMIWGLEFKQSAVCQAVAREAFARRLVIETCGSERNVLKFLPPLITDETMLAAGVEIVRESIRQVVEYAGTSVSQNAAGEG